MSAETNKGVIRRYRDIYNRNALDELGEVLEANFTAHSMMPGLPAGIEGAKAAHLATIAMFPDLKITTEDLIAEGDKVVERWTQTCTHTGAPFFIGNIPASGKKIRASGISIYRLERSKIVEHWAEFDFVNVLQQIGAMQTPG